MYAKQFDNQSIATFRQWLSEARHIVLAAHINADGDACGSLLGFSQLIEMHTAHGTKVTPILPNGCPKNFEWLPESGRILSGDLHAEECRRAIGEADLIVCLDLNTPDRTGSLAQALIEAQGHKVLVDHHHHPDEEHFGVIFSDPDISSTCELVLWLSEALWPGDSLNLDIATCLYTGLRTDTGGFAFSCKQPSCFEAAARLVAYGLDSAEINDHINNNFTVDRMRFYGFALTQRLRIFEEKRTAYFYFSLADQQAYRIGAEEMEGLVNYTLMMRDIRTGALLREEPDGRTKVSLRAKAGGDVNRLARQINGGGHTLAAGGTCYGTFDEAIQTVENLLGIRN